MPKKLSFAQNALYNTVGSIFYCFCQWATTMFVVRFFDSYDFAGIFQLSISITNIFFAISTYNMHTFQISDIDNVYSSGDYIGMRIITSFLAFILCVGYSVVLGYPVKTVLCIAAYMLFKINESMSDVYHGIDQKNYRMDYIGISYIIRGLIMITVFAFSLYLTRDVLISTALMAASTLIFVFTYDTNRAALFGSIKPEFNIKKLSAMLIKCMPAVIASSSFTAIVTVPRQFLESMHGEAALGSYATVATPIVIIQVLATGIFNPLLTDITKFYNERDNKSLVKMLGKTLLFLTGFTLIAYIGAFLLGDFALSLVYGASIHEYTYLMYAIIGCTFMYAVCWLCSNLLIIMRKLLPFMAVSVTSLIFSALISRPMINMFYMNGVSYTIIISYIAYVLICSLLIYSDLKKR